MGLFDSMGEIFGRIADFFLDIRITITGLPSTIRELARTRPKLLIIGAVGFLALLFLLIEVIVFAGQAAGRGNMRDSDAIAELFQVELPAEELFLEDEPDFLPEALLEREQRDEWTAADARPYWTDPKDEGEKVYEDMMSTAVDRIMERVP